MWKICIFRDTFQLKVVYFEKIYPSLFPHCIKGCQNEQHLLLFPEPSYGTQTFLSTAGTVVPIFLQPWLLATCHFLLAFSTITKLYLLLVTCTWCIMVHAIYLVFLSACFFLLAPYLLLASGFLLLVNRFLLLDSSRSYQIDQ